MQESCFETVRVISLLLKSHLIHCLTESIRTMSLSQPFSLELDSCSDPFAETSQGWSVSPGEICLLPYSEDQNQVVPPLFERSDAFDAIDEFASSIDFSCISNLNEWSVSRSAGFDQGLTRFRVAQSASSEMIPGGSSSLDITSYFEMSQRQAAQCLRLSPSVLSGRWKMASNGRAWPQRRLKKINRDILTLLQNLRVYTGSIDQIETLRKLANERDLISAPVAISYP